MKILSTLSNTYNSSDASSPSIFVRLLWRVFKFIKSLSLIQYSSQDELATYTDANLQTVQKAMRLLRKAAKSENSDAIYLLGELNFVLLSTTFSNTNPKYGNYSEVNYREAFKWFEKSAQKDGNATALHLLGFMHATGIGNAVEADQGAVFSPISPWGPDLGIIVSFIRCDGGKHSFRDDCCVQTSHGNRNPSKL